MIQKLQLAAGLMCEIEWKQASAGHAVVDLMRGDVFFRNADDTLKETDGLSVCQVQFCDGVKTSCFPSEFFESFHYPPTGME